MVLGSHAVYIELVLTPGEMAMGGHINLLKLDYVFIDTHFMSREKGTCKCHDSHADSIQAFVCPLSALWGRLPVQVTS